MLTETIYAVGKLRNYTTRRTLEDGRIREFGVFWFGQPSLFSPTELARVTEKTFTHMASFFGDNELFYRIVIRFNPIRGFGGTAFTRSFILEYDAIIVVEDGEIFSTLAHEMVHNRPRMEGGSSTDAEGETIWFSEGAR